MASITKYPGIIAAAMACVLSSPAFAVWPEVIIDYCADRKQVNTGIASTEAHHRTGFVIGFLAAITDSLQVDGWECAPLDEEGFCSTFREYIIDHNTPQGSSFDHARKAILQGGFCKRAS